MALGYTSTLARLKAFTRKIETKTQFEDEELRQIAANYWQMAETYQQQKRLQSAVQSYYAGLKASNQIKQFTDADYSDMAKYSTCLGDLEMNAQHFTAAVKAYRHAIGFLTGLSRRGWEEQMDDACIHYSCSMAYFSSKQFHEAATYVRRALDLIAPYLERSATKILSARLGMHLADVLVAMQDVVAAQVAAERAMQCVAMQSDAESLKIYQEAAELNEQLLAKANLLKLNSHLQQKVSESHSNGTKLAILRKQGFFKPEELKNAYVHSKQDDREAFVAYCVKDFMT